MPTADFESLTKPVSEEAPCGEDLDLGGDLDYLNFLAGAEGLLPKSYFGRDQSGNEGRPFDRTTIDFESQFNAALPFLAKTRDLRLLGILAKFSILNRDLGGFITCIRAIATLLAEHWDEVHPRAEDGDFGFRMVSVEGIEAVPTVILPLQFVPLIEHKRFGSVSHRNYLIAKGEVQPIEGETAMDLASVERVLQEAEMPALIERRQQLVELDAALKQIRSVWLENCTSGPPVGLERLPASVEQMFELLNTAILKRDPSAALSGAAVGDAEPADGTEGADAVPMVGAINSAASAGRALAAVAAYFSRSEPSNPALMLVRQALDLPGKSFFEVIQLLVPDYVNQAAVNIGREQYFHLPIERLAAAGAGQESAAGAGADAAEGEPAFAAKSRAEALVLLDQVGQYFRTAEPSSPIPFFTDRARDLATRDFLSVLKALLPADTLKSMQ